jgi:hypothetical protein
MLVAVTPGALLLPLEEPHAATATAAAAAIATDASHLLLRPFSLNLSSSPGGVERIEYHSRRRPVKVNFVTSCAPRLNY